RADPLARPVEVGRVAQPILIRVVLNADVVGRRRDDYVDAPGRELPEDLDAVTQVEPANRLALPPRQGIWLHNDRHNCSSFRSVASRTLMQGNEEEMPAGERAGREGTRRAPAPRQVRGSQRVLRTPCWRG